MLPVTSRQTFSPRARNCHAGENAPEISSFRERSPKPSGNFHVTFLGPEAVDAVPQWQQDASSITASMPIRAGSLTLKMTASVIRADGPGLRASGKVSFHRLQCGCAVEARRMMRAEASLGTGARTERACSLSAWRARGRRQRGRPRAAGAVVRARSGCTTMCWRSPLANKLARRFPYAGASNHRQCCFSQGKCSGQLRTLGHAVLS
jgi:hypothetical protein